MIKYLYILCCVLLILVSCAEKKQEKVKEELLMYEPSEMAILMRQMYEYNKVLRQQIISQDSLSLPSYPEEFLNIHSAVMTDDTERDSAFEALSKRYLELQQSIFTNKDSAKENFNKSVVTCVECHTTRCDGPIPKIKRLLIN